MSNCKGERLKETCWLVFRCSQNVTESFDCALRDLHDDGIFISFVHGLFSVEALCISWLIQETALSNIFMCQCHGLALLGGSVDVVSQCGAHVYTKLSYIKHCWWCDWRSILYVWNASVLLIFFCLFRVLPLTKVSCCVKCCILYCILILVLFWKAPQRTLHSTAKLMCVRTRMYSLLLHKI